MIDNNSEFIAEQAKKIYEDELRHKLEKTHLNRFVSIEPGSGEYFLGNTLSEAIGASRQKYPDRLVHTFRIGHPAAVHLGFGQ